MSTVHNPNLPFDFFISNLMKGKGNGAGDPFAHYADSIERAINMNSTFVSIML
jgi:hypothetical protein